MSSVNPPVQAQGQKNILAAFAKNLQRESHVLKDRPDLLWQQMFNRLQWEPEPLRSLLESAVDQREGQWTKRFSEIHESKALIRTIEAHLEPVEDCTGVFIKLPPCGSGSHGPAVSSKKLRFKPGFKVFNLLADSRLRYVIAAGCT